MSQMIMSRRTLLRGLGTALALPVLDSVIPTRLLSAEAKAAAKVATAPRRVAWIYVPNGVVIPSWTPAEMGADYKLTPTLQPLADFKDKFSVVSGLVCDKANPNGDGPGDHARAMSAYLSGAQPRKTEGANLKLGISADQAAADKIGHLTKFPSLELGIEEGKQVGRCDSGYSCAYSHTLSWRSDTTPVVKDCDPQSVFDRLFSNGDPRESAESRARRQRRIHAGLPQHHIDGRRQQRRRQIDLAAQQHRRFRREKIAQYAADPRSLSNNVMQLRGEPGHFRLRVGDWRIIFTESLEVVAVIRIGAPRRCLRLRGGSSATRSRHECANHHQPDRRAPVLL